MAAAMIERTLWDRHDRDRACLQEHRHLPLHWAVLGALGPLTGVRLLDVGCGVGLLLREAAERGAWVAGVDAAPERLEIARWALADADLRVGDLAAIPYANGRFDAATACNVLQYADAPEAALAEIVRVVRPGGKIAIGHWGDPPTGLLDGALQAAGLDVLERGEHTLFRYVLATKPL
jgi:ubiquinone/menaquinone biosynthesis C-methylase UbiE